MRGLRFRPPFWKGRGGEQTLLATIRATPQLPRTSPERALLLGMFYFPDFSSHLDLFSACLQQRNFQDGQRHMVSNTQKEEVRGWLYTQHWCAQMPAASTALGDPGELRTMGWGGPFTKQGCCTWDGEGVKFGRREYHLLIGPLLST